MRLRRTIARSGLGGLVLLALSAPGWAGCASDLELGKSHFRKYVARAPKLEKLSKEYDQAVQWSRDISWICVLLKEMWGEADKMSVDMYRANKAFTKAASSCAGSQREFALENAQLAKKIQDESREASGAFWSSHAKSCN